MSRKVIIFTLLSIVAFLFFVPFLWMLLTSIKPEKEIFAYPPHLIPSAISATNYYQLMEKTPFALFTLNSFLLVIINIIGAILSSIFPAYAFARFNFPGRNVLFVVVLAAMIIPQYVIILPLYVLMKNLGWLDTYLPLTVPSFFCYSLGIFLLRQFFLTIPKELDDAARIDGCNNLGILWRIYVPLSKPPLITLAIFMAIFQWNDLLRPIVYLDSPSKMPLSVGLVMIQGEYTVQWNLLMAAALLSIIPMVVVFIVLQRYYIQGIITSGLKG
ncbi:carbohydrate ABC transporter permease [Candidatus Aerophobetes bacterium]|nr:carbohydrate ABC transporter permease [Candidatus Aerophobetes bacterium]